MRPSVTHSWTSDCVSGIRISDSEDIIGALISASAGQLCVFIAELNA